MLTHRWSQDAVRYCQSERIISKISHCTHSIAKLRYNMTSRLSFRGTTFNIPSNRLLWVSLGEYDSLVEYQEVACRLMLAGYDKTKESFREYLIRISQSTGVYLNDITLQNYKQSQYQGYLIFPNASFDEFLSGFADDVRILIDESFAESKIEGCRFDKLIDSLKKYNITPNIDEAKVNLYHYYRLLRNDVAHRLNKNYDDEYKVIDLNAIHSFYPTLSVPQPKMSLTFDDFILCTANVKNIADEMTRSLLPHIDWVKLATSNIDKWIPKRKRFVAEGRINRLKSSIRTKIFTVYGIKISDYDIEKIVSSLE